VEDEEEGRALAVRVLEENGYRTCEASTLEEALEIFEREGDIRLLFSDVMLPDGSGVELVERLQSERERLGALFTSGYTDDRSMLSEIRRRRWQFLRKPYTPLELLQAVRRAITPG